MSEEYAGECLDETPETMLSGELHALARTHASEQPNQPGVANIIERVAQLYVEDIYGENPTCSVSEELEWGRDLARRLIDAGLIGGTWHEGWVRHAESAERRASSWWEAAKEYARIARTRQRTYSFLQRRYELLASQHRNETARADAAEEKLGTAQADVLSAEIHRDAAQAIAENEAALSRRYLAERDVARAKLDEIRDTVAEVHVDAGDHYQDNDDCIDGCPACALANVRKIVAPEDTRG
ncbi:hypothetical protein AB0383_20250 [Amycolatopsis sp. NPDC051373]|uniref:hypothetical protein n=1 Tax=Amycolatopsis sp. NPDC051373 TaxID=3155801 RepID=UPI00344DC2EC